MGKERTARVIREQQSQSKFRNPIKRKQILKTNTTTSLIALTKKVQLRKIDDVHVNDDTTKFVQQTNTNANTYENKRYDELTTVLQKQ